MSKKFDEKLAEVLFDIPLQDVDGNMLEKLRCLKILIASDIVGKKYGPLPTGYYPDTHKELDAKIDLQLETLGLSDTCESCGEICGASRPYGTDCLESKS